MFAGRAAVPRSNPVNVRTRTRVTARAAVPNVLHVRTQEWPQQAEFLAQLDRLKERHGIRYDAALAEVAGISHTAISNWRLGKVRPSTAALTRLADALDEPSHPLIVAAGIIQGMPAGDDTIELPAQLRRLVDLYKAAGKERRVEILARVQFVVEWAEATDRAPIAERPRRRPAV